MCFSKDFCDIFKNIFFIEHIWPTVSKCKDTLMELKSFLCKYQIDSGKF